MTLPSLHIAAVEQDRVTFHCEHSTAIDIFWSVDAPFRGHVNTSIGESERPAGGMASSLTIKTLLEYNETSVECGVIVDRESAPQYTPSAMLLIQG